MKFEELYEELEKAKRNIRWLLDNDNGSVDFHDLSYWAGKVEQLREEIKNNL